MTPTRRRGQSGCPRREARGPPLQRERGARRAMRVIGLVAAAVERRHHAVAGELLDVASEVTGDEGRGHAPVGVEHAAASPPTSALRSR